MQVLSGSSAFCILAVCGLVLRSQALISAARSPNFAPSNPAVESSTLTLEMNAVIVLLVLFLATPAFLTMILMPRSQLMLHVAATAMRKSFGGFAKETSRIQSASLQEQGMSEAFDTAVDSGHSRDIEFTHEQQNTTLHVDCNRIGAVKGITSFDASLCSIQSQTSIATSLDISRFRQLRCDAIDEHAGGSMIQPRASPPLTNTHLGVVRLSGNNSSAADQIHAPIHQEPKVSPSLYSDAMFAAVTPRLESSSSAKYSEAMSPLDPYMVESDDEFDSVFVHAASSAMLSSRSLVWSSGGSKSRRPLPLSRSRSFSRTKQASGSDVSFNTANEVGHASVDSIVESRASTVSDSCHSSLYMLQP
jgi:hypothetical protein